MRPGISTGTCATAAATAAARSLLGHAPDSITSVEVVLPDGEIIEVAVRSVERTSPIRACADVVKDAGDDIDVTDGAIIGACVEIEEGSDAMRFAAGPGVGVVTREGLQLAVGEPAINPVPREMIAGALVRELGSDVSALVTVSVIGGVELARKTFNPRLGIEGGISIIGTTGRVEPKSDEAWMRSLLPQVSMARAAGHDVVYLAPGGIGESYAIDVLHAPGTAVVQCSNFVGDLLDACAGSGIRRVVLVGHAGKLTKVAAGLFNTHSRFGDARLETVAALAGAYGAPASVIERILGLATVQAAIDLLRASGLEHVWGRVADRVRDRAFQHVDGAIDIDVVLLGYRGEVLASTLADEPATRPQVLSIVGVGPGDPSLVTPAASARIATTDVVVGGSRLLDGFVPGSSAAERIALGADVVAGIGRALEAAAGGRRVVVLASGDPSFFGILSTVRREFPEAALDVVPGISSAQLALARVGERWDTVTFVSAHGRELDAAVDAVVRADRALVLVDRDNTPVRLAGALVDAGFPDGSATVLERLSYPDERVRTYTLADLAALEPESFDPLSLVFVTRNRKEVTE